jgi:hypothetical protein
MTDESCISEMISVSEFLARPLGITKYFLYFICLRAWFLDCMEN